MRDFANFYHHYPQIDPLELTIIVLLQLIECIYDGSLVITRTEPVSEYHWMNESAKVMDNRMMVEMQLPSMTPFEDASNSDWFG